MNHIIMQIRSSIFPITVALLLGCWGQSAAQSTFQKIISVPDSLTTGFCTAETTSGNTVVAGAMAKNFNTGLNIATVWMLDGNGDKLWERKLGNIANSGFVADVKGLSDGNVLVTTSAYQNFSLVSSTVIKLDANNGATIWAKVLNNNTDTPMDNIALLNNGFILSGASATSNSSNVVRFDDNGVVVWKKRFDGVAVGKNGICEDSEGNIHLAGRAPAKGVWMKLKGDTGNILGQKEYDHPDILAFFVATAVSNDSILIAGTDFEDHVVLLKMDLNGTTGRSTRFNLSGDNIYPADVSASGGGSFVVCINQASSGILAAFSGNLTSTWTKSYGNSNGNTAVFYEMSNSTAGYLAAGSMKTGSLEQLYLVRTDFGGDIIGACCPADINLNFSPLPVITTPGNISESAIDNYITATISNITADAEVTERCPSGEKIALTNGVLCPGQCATLNMDGTQANAVYEWSLEGGSPDTSNAVNPGQVCYINKGNYDIILTREGCFIDSTHVSVDDLTPKFPNAFTPNGDQTNPVLIPVLGECPIEEYRMQVFNRWGDLVFETFNQKEGWDGTVNGKPAAVDVYIYRVEFYAYVDGVRTLIFNENKEAHLIR